MTSMDGNILEFTYKITQPQPIAILIIYKESNV